MQPRRFEALVRQAVEGLPDQFKDALQNIDLVIEDRLSAQHLREMGYSPEDGPLLGLYEGTPLPDRELGETYFPDRITIYREEILDMGLTGTELVEEIRITVLHEIGHYFGLDDDHMEEIGY